MPEITATPILPVALTPASTAQASSGRIAPADTGRSTAPAQKADDASKDPGATQSDAADSFARILQQQLSQNPAAPATAATQVVDPTLGLAPLDLLAADVAAQSFTLAMNGRGEATRSLVPAGTELDTGAALALNPLQQAAVAQQDEDRSVQSLPAATLALDPAAKLLSAAEPVATTQSAPALSPNLVAPDSKPLAKAKSDPEAAADAMLAAQSPYLPGLATQPAIQYDAAPLVAEGDSGAESDAALQLAAAMKSFTKSPPDDSSHALPTKLAEATQAMASKTAEFAAALPLAGDAAPRLAGPDVAADANFENLLAAAQAFSQGRNPATHAPGHNATSLPVATPVGARGWDDEVSNKLVWMIGRQEQRAELVLNPPQLGRVEVSLSLSSGQTNALFVSANPVVRDALEAALPRLREMLADAGVTLGQAQVGADSGSSNAANQSTNSRENWDNSGHAMNRLGSINGLDSPSPVTSVQWLRQSNGLVDVFA